MNITAFIIIMLLATAGFALSFGVSTLYRHNHYVSKQRFQLMVARSALISVVTIFVVAVILVEIFS